MPNFQIFGWRSPTIIRSSLIEPDRAVLEPIYIDLNPSSADFMLRRFTKFLGIEALTIATFVTLAVPLP